MYVSKVGRGGGKILLSIFTLIMLQFSIIACIWCLCVSTYSIRKSVWSVFESRQATYRQVVVAGVSTVTFKAAFRKFYGRYNNLVYQYDLPLSQILSDVFHSHC